MRVSYVVSYVSIPSHSPPSLSFLPLVGIILKYIMKFKLCLCLVTCVGYFSAVKDMRLVIVMVDG